MRISCLLLFVTLSAAFGASVPAIPASGEAIAIGSGREGGYYHDVALAVSAVIGTSSPLLPVVRVSAGSVENLGWLHDPESTVALALTQIDALKYFIGQNPEFAGQYMELGDVGRECAILVTGKGSGVTGLGDLKSAEAGAIAVGRPGSGASVTWEYMNQLEPALRATRPIDLGIIEALLALKQSASVSEVKAAMLVQRTRATGTPVEIVLEEREAYTIVPIREGDVASSKLESGRAVYTFENVRLGFGRDFQQKVDTICTRGLLIASKAKLSEDQLSLISSVVANNRSFITPGVE